MFWVDKFHVISKWIERQNYGPHALKTNILCGASFSRMISNKHILSHIFLELLVKSYFFIYILLLFTFFNNLIKKFNGSCV